MTHEEYQRICERLARKTIRYAAEKVADEEPSDDLDAQCEHWINVYLDEHLPDIDADALLDVTGHADAFEKSTGRPAPSRAIAAVHAFQADVWDANNRGGHAVKSVRVVVRHLMSRVAFRAGTFEAWLESEDDYSDLGKTRGHETWAEAAAAALKLADRRGYLVANRALVERKIAEST